MSSKFLILKDVSLSFTPSVLSVHLSVLSSLSPPHDPQVFILDRRLREQGVGVGERENLFGLVGFARDSPSDIIGIVLSQLASPENFVAASQVSIDGCC